MNIRRGLFRIWLVLSVLWAVFTIGVGIGDFYKQASFVPTESWRDELRRKNLKHERKMPVIGNDEDYRVLLPGTAYIDPNGRTRRKREPPKEIPKPHPSIWPKIPGLILGGILPPAIVYGLGLICLWAFAGFRKPPEKSD